MNQAEKEKMDDFDAEVYVLKSTKGTYFNKTSGRTKFIRRAVISDYMSVYEAGIEAFNEGHRDLSASGILKLTEIDVENEKDKKFIIDYLKGKNICIINTDKGYVKYYHYVSDEPTLKVHIGFTDSIKQACLFDRDVLEEREKELCEVMVGNYNVQHFSVEFLDESFWSHDKKIVDKQIISTIVTKKRE